MRFGRTALRYGSGFTLVELIVVIIVISILAAFVVPRWSGGTGFEERGLRDQMAAALRYAQKSAIAARRTVCVNTSVANAVSFRISSAYPAANCDAGTALSGPDGQDLAVVAKAPAAFAAVPASFAFDATGRPNPNAAVVFGFSGLPGALNLTVQAETGYVH